MLTLIKYLTIGRILSGIPTGTFGRWAFGVIILTHLIAYNESSSAAILIAVLIALINSLLAGNYYKNIYYEF